jgi:hypothetical protein
MKRLPPLSFIVFISHTKFLRRLVRFSEIVFLMIRSKKSTEKWAANKMKSGGNIKLRSYETAQEAKRQKN